MEHAEHRWIHEQDVLLGGRVERREAGPHVNQMHEPFENPRGVRVRDAELVE